MTRVGVARWCGRLVQALVLGVLLALACVQLLNMLGGSSVFRYQGF